MEGAFLRSVAPPTSVADAAVGAFLPCRAGPQLLLPVGGGLQLWGVEEGREGGLGLLGEWRVAERVEAVRAVPLGGGVDGALLLTSDQFATLVGWQQGDDSLAPRPLCAAVPLSVPAEAVPEGRPPAVPRLAGTYLSEGHRLPGRAGQLLFAAALCEDKVHIITATPAGASGGRRALRAFAASAERLRLIQSHPQSAQGLVRSEDMVTVLSMAFMPAGPSGVNLEGRPLLTVLHANTGYLGQAVHLQCMAVDLECGALLAGPWAVRNLHPTTRLLKPLALEPEQGMPGVVAISSRGCQLFTEETAEPQRPVEMGGTPAAAAEVSPGLWVIGDSSGLLWSASLLGEPTGWRIDPIQPPQAGAAPGYPALSTAEVLCCIPTAEERLLFLGSHHGPSQLLAATHEGASSGRWSLVEPLFLDSLAPIHAALSYEEPAGSGEQHLALCGGCAPTGRVAFASLGVGREALANGGALPGPAIFASVREWGEAHHALLVLSFEAPQECTRLMAMQDGFLSLCELPGLDADSSTLLMTGMPGGWLIQVTPREVRVLGRSGRPRELHASWPAPSGRITQVTAHNGHILVAAGTALHALRLDEESGQVLASQREEYAQQVSALALVALPGGGCLAAVGTWGNDAVALYGLSRLGQPLAGVALPQGQARSITSPTFDGSPHLVVGTSAGVAVVYALQMTGEEEALEVSMEPLLSVQVGSGAVRLVMMEDPETQQEIVYAQSSADALIRCRWGGGPEAFRVHTNGQPATSLAAFSTPEAPAGLAWAGQDQELMFGQLDARVALRWRVSYLGDTPLEIAYHKASGCFVVLSRDIYGSSAIRLVHSTSLSQVSFLQLEDRHQPCAVLSAPLRCSSVDAVQSSLPATQACPQKEFVVVSSYLVEGDTDPGAGSSSARGLLSVFDVLYSADAGGERYEIVLHGSQPIPGVAHSLEALPLSGPGDTPDDKKATPQAGAQARVGEPLVVLGCHDALYTARIFVDDTASIGLAAVEAAMSSLRCGEPICAVAGLTSAAAEETAMDASEPASGSEPAATQSGTAQAPPSQEAGTQWEHWRQRVQLEILSATGGATDGCVTSMSALGDSLLVSELLGSTSVYKAGVDGSAALARISADISPVFSSAACQISADTSLLNVQPYGLMLLRRDRAAEREREVALLQQAVKEREAGVGRPTGGARHAPAEPQPEIVLPPLQVLALCRKPQLVVRFCRGRLGFPSPNDSIFAGGGCALYVTSCGMVGAVALLPLPATQALHALQVAMQAVEPGGATEHRHADMWTWTYSALREAGGGGGGEADDGGAGSAKRRAAVRGGGRRPVGAAAGARRARRGAEGGGAGGVREGRAGGGLPGGARVRAGGQPGPGVSCRPRPCEDSREPRANAGVKGYAT
eukprot:jgi/Tetstr1/427078/TSEL_017282.t1